MNKDKQVTITEDDFIRKSGEVAKELMNEMKEPGVALLVMLVTAKLTKKLFNEEQQEGAA